MLTYFTELAFDFGGVELSSSKRVDEIMFETIHQPCSQYQCYPSKYILLYILFHQIYTFNIISYHSFFENFNQLH
ncbi:unnamed protein product [Cunninghamella echinulata]